MPALVCVVPMVYDKKNFLTYLTLYLEFRYSFLLRNMITSNDYFQNVTIDQSTTIFNLFSLINYVLHLTVLCVENLFGTTIIYTVHYADNSYDTQYI
jgi:hypothetical protein